MPEQTPTWVPAAVDPPAGAPLPAVAAAGGAPRWAPEPPLPAEEGAADDDPWPSHATRRGVRMRVPTAVLAALLIAAGAFWGGAALQRSRTPATVAGGIGSRFRSLFAGASGARGAGSGLGAASTPAASGLLTAVRGDVLYLTDSSGNLVKIVVGSSTTVTEQSSAKLKALPLGDDVVVQGSTAANGTVTATSVTASAPGLSAGASVGSAGAGATAGGSSPSAAGGAPAGGASG